MLFFLLVKMRLVENFKLHLAHIIFDLDSVALEVEVTSSFPLLYLDN